MAGKLTAIFARNEAETYDAQGLHKEALAIYKHLLTSCPHLDPAFREAVQGRMRQIEGRLNEMPEPEGNRLTLNDILRIRKGWGAEAGEEDLLVCAQAFCLMGHYPHALAELETLMQKGIALPKINGLLADCFIRIYPPAELIEGVEKLTRQLRWPSELVLEMLLGVGREMAGRKAADHAALICRHLEQIPEAAARHAAQLAAFKDEIQMLRAGDQPKADKQETMPDQATFSTAPGFSKALKWVAAIKKSMGFTRE